MMQPADGRREKRPGVLGKVLAPAVALMDRLKYPHKFALISLLFLAPLALIGFFLLTEIGAQVDSSTRELQGSRYLRPLHKLSDDLARVREMEKADGDAGRDEFAQARQRVDFDFQAVEKLDGELGAILGTTHELGRLKASWGRIDWKTAERATDGPADQLDRLAAGITSLARVVGDSSNLILDPDLDTYYLMDAVLLKLPDVEDRLNRVERIGEAGKSADSDAATLAALAGLIRSDREAIHRGLAVASQNSARDLRKAFSSPLQDYLNATGVFLHEAERVATAARGAKESRNALAGLAVAARKATLSLWDRSVAELDVLVQARVDRFLAKGRLVVGFTLPVLLAVAYFWAGFYLSVIQTVSSLGRAAGRMVGGDLEVAAVVCTRDELGGVVRAFNDVADRLRHEWAQARDESARARDAEERTRQIIETAMDAIAVIDAGGRIVEWNPQAESTFGLSRGEAIGRPLLETIFPVGSTEGFDLDLLPTGTGDRANHGERVEVSARHRDGRSIPVEASVAPFQAAGGAGYSLFMRDVSDRRRAREEAHRAEELRVTKEAAEAACRAKSDFLATMSHEIRTPMNGIIGMTELALDTELSHEQREYLGMVRSSAEALLLVINDILDFSKIEAGKLDLDPVEFGLRDGLADTLKTLSLRAHGKGLELACRIAPEVPDALVGDPGRLRQIVVNLVGNAVKFTEVGEVFVEVTLKPGDGDGVALHFAVADTGIGIPAGRVEAIFAPFEQADGSTTRRYGGTGLGLAISSRLVAMMGGRIWVESEPGQGSRFHFTARFERGSGPDSSHSPMPVADVAGLKALVVDDNRTNRLILEEVLTSWGVRPSAACDGPSALAALRDAKSRGEPFNLVLLDGKMPGMDGFEVAERIGGDATLGKPSIMMLTSSGFSGEVARCRALGVAAYLLKPVKQSELLKAILAIIPGSGSVAGDRPSAHQAAAATAPPRGEHGLRVLLVEDNKVNQALAVGLLRRWGHAYTVANDGLEALEVLDRARFDVVLMDLQMPNLDGFGALAVIRQRESERPDGGHQQVIALTAHALKGDRQRCLDAGFDDYLTKPILRAQFLAALDRVRGLDDEAPDAGNAQEATTQPARLLDLAQALESVEGDKGLLRELAELYVENCPGVLSAVREAVEAGDAPALFEAAHTAKGYVSHFAADAAYHAAQELEAMGHDGDLSGAARALDLFEGLYGRLRSELEALALAAL
jgi:two-component system sensor histidine kinase/response regulator